MVGVGCRVRIQDSRLGVYGLGSWGCGLRFLAYSFWFMCCSRVQVLDFKVEVEDLGFGVSGLGSTGHDLGTWV